jgi:hypothetical protein
VPDFTLAQKRGRQATPKKEFLIAGQSVWMHEGADRLGFPVKCVTVKNAGHSFEDASKEPISMSVLEISKRTRDFLLKNNK